MSSYSQLGMAEASDNVGLSEIDGWLSEILGTIVVVDLNTPFVGQGMKQWF